MALHWQTDGDISFDSPGSFATSNFATIDLDVLGAFSINSSGGAINIGDDAVAQPLNLGIAGARDIAIGSAVATGIDFTVDTAGDIEFIVEATAQATVDTDGLTLASGASINEFSIDGTLVGDSDDAVPTEKAVKTYVDAAISASDSLQEAYNVGNTIAIAGTDNLDVDVIPGYGLRVHAGGTDQFFIDEDGTTAQAINITADLKNFDLDVSGEITVDGILSVGQSTPAAGDLDFTTLAIDGTGAVTVQSGGEGLTLTSTGVTSSVPIYAPIIDDSNTVTFSFPGYPNTGMFVYNDTLGGSDYFYIIADNATDGIAYLLINADTSIEIATTGGSSNIDVVSAGFLHLKATASYITFNTAATTVITLSSLGAVDINPKFNYDLTVEVTGSGNIDIDAAGTGSVAIDSGVGGIGITAAGANVSLTTTGSGDVSLTAVDEVTFAGDDYLFGSAAVGIWADSLNLSAGQVDSQNAVASMTHAGVQTVGTSFTRLQPGTAELIFGVANKSIAGRAVVIGMKESDTEVIGYIIDFVAESATTDTGSAQIHGYNVTEIGSAGTVTGYDAQVVGAADGTNYGRIEIQVKGEANVSWSANIQTSEVVVSA